MWKIAAIAVKPPLRNFIKYAKNAWKANKKPPFNFKTRGMTAKAYREFDFAEHMKEKKKEREFQKTHFKKQLIIL